MELKPCPFCGRTDLLGFEPYPDLSGFISVRCRACGCIGPSKLSDTKSESISLWNSRVENEKK
jgi:Lar family restriction alleviation protein